MTIKIGPTGNPRPAAQTDGTGGTTPATAAAGDPVTQIAAELASGNITVNEAVDRLISHTTQTGMVKEAPAAMREEVARMLRTAIETDPYLKRLAASLE